MIPKIAVTIGTLKLKNPVMVASGTFGYGEEFVDFLDVKKLGAIVSKTITVGSRPGNLPPRTCETPAGMLNSIGLENPGIERFIKEKIPYVKKLGIPHIVSIASEGDPREFVKLARRLDTQHAVAALELNISCPNIHSKLKAPGSKLISQDAQATFEVVKAVRKVTKKTLITKLSPNVTSVTDIARAAEDAGSDAVCLINTLTGMSIDTETRRPKIGQVIGGLSGPAVRPVAIRMVWEVYRKVRIPIIGMGGIIDTASAIEFFLAGATAVSVGTANFVNPRASAEIVEGIKKYLARHAIKDIRNLRGGLRT